MEIRPLDPERDAEAIAAVYRPYVTDTDISFEEEAPTAADMASRLARFTRRVPGFVMVAPDGRLAGYCYTRPWKSFAGYRDTLETTVYVALGFERRGVGRALMERLIGECRSRGVVALIACITAGNRASIILHEKLGFSQASHFEAVGRKHGRYLDIVDYQLQLKATDTQR